MEVRELHLYSEKISGEDVKNLFNRIVKSRFPLFGFLELSEILSLGAVTFIVKRNNNTVRFYIKEKECLQSISSLVFPFRLCDTTLMKPSTGSYFPFPRLYMISGGKHDMIDLMMKENIEQLTLSITKVAGKFIAKGTAINESGQKGLVVVFSPHNFLKIDLEKNPSIYIELLEPLPKKIYTSSKFPVFEETGMSLGVDNYDPLQHTIIAGTSGSGKSKALFVLLRAIEKKYGSSVRTIIVDPHGEFAKLMPHARIVNFIDNYVEPLDVGKEKTPMLTQLVSQLMASSIGQENKYSERVLFYAVHLLSSIGKLELNSISALLTDTSVKAEFVSQCDNDEVKRFFDEEYNDIHIHHFNTAILPILNFIGEYQLYLGKEKKRECLIDLLQQHNTTIVSFDPKFFGRRMISFLAGAVINQMYILAITGKLEGKPTILVVDEFPRVETRVTKDILAETRKFGLFAYLSCQYLGQLSKEVQDSIISNTRNIIAFKINKQDAALLSSIMEIKLEEYFKKHRAQTELEESKKDMFVRLNQRECIVRLYDGAKYLLPMKLRIVDAKRYGLREDKEVSTIQPTLRNHEAAKGANVTAYATENFTSLSKQKESDDVDDADNGDPPPGVPLHYRQKEAMTASRGQASEVESARDSTQTQDPETRARRDESQSETQDSRLETQDLKQERPPLPDPITDSPWLQETPDAIYRLGKKRMEEHMNEGPSSKPPDNPPDVPPAETSAPVDKEKSGSKSIRSKAKPRSKKK